MHPILFTTPWGLTVYSYPAVYLFSMVFFSFLAWWLARRYDIKTRHFAALGFLMFLAYFVAAHVIFILLTLGPQGLLYRKHLFSLYGYWGGQLLFVLAAAGYVLLAGLPFGVTMDVVSAALAATLVIQKIGCFLGGCCYGKPTELPWAVKFPAGHIHGIGGIPVHPTQLYDSFCALLIFLVLLNLLRRGRGEGFLFPLFGLLYAVSRFITEMFRGDILLAMPFLGLRSTQWIEIAVALFCLAILFPLRGKWKAFLDGR